MSNWQKKYFEEICEYANFDASGFSDDEITNIINKSFELAPLTDKERKVAYACIINGMSQTDCAKELGVSKSTISSKLVDIRRKILEWSGIKAGSITITSDEFEQLTLYAAGLEKQICRELSSWGIHFVKQLTAYTEEGLYSKHLLGPVHFSKLKEFMQEHNVKFATSDTNTDSNDPNDPRATVAKQFLEQTSDTTDKWVQLAPSAIVKELNAEDEYTICYIALCIAKKIQPIDTDKKYFGC